MGTAIYHDFKSPRRSLRPPHSFTTLIPLILWSLQDHPFSLVSPAESASSIRNHCPYFLNGRRIPPFREKFLSLSPTTCMRRTSLPPARSSLLLRLCPWPSATLFGRQRRM